MEKRKTGIFLFNRKSLGQRIRIKVIVPMVIAVAIGLFFLSGHLVEKQAYLLPAYEKEDLNAVLHSNAALTDRDYDFLYHQTGLGRPAVESLIDDTSGSWVPEAENKLEEAQELLFSYASSQCVSDSFIVRREQTVDESGQICGRNHLDYLEDGDILVTNASHIGGWRNGHAAIVVDAEAGKTLEAITIFEDSAVRNISKWEKYPNVAVLRLKGASIKQRQAVAQWARENLLGKPYQITAGVFNGKGTQCAHLVWKAYQEFGYDLNTQGGRIVTPKKLANSSVLEVVQICGMNLDEIWE